MATSSDSHRTAGPDSVRNLSSDATRLLLTLTQKADPSHCALLVIDVQNDFAAEGGFFDKVGGDLRAIQKERVPALLKLIAEARPGRRSRDLCAGNL
jgi:hypothetical protein